MKSVPKNLCSSLKQETRYVFDEQLGSGATGTVVLAHRPSPSGDDEYRAIKIIPHANSKSYWRERKALETLKGYRNVIHIEAAITSLENCYIVMQPCVGDLNELANDTSSLPEAECKPLFKQMAFGLIAAHSKRICHHDVKLDNFLVASDGAIKLTDFGYSISMDDKAYTTKINGKRMIIGEYCASSPAYSSPQVLLREPHSPHLTDIYSLGVCLYRLLCGRFPFCDPAEDELEELVKNASRGDLSFPGFVSFEARELIQGMLQVHEEDRFGWSEIINHSWCFYE
eukprot:TRINITY_DN582_c0_g1_i1.p1 TRINITY_DN582_c0_g1~~TRINITY_DN582_c0_g1_i1.p1  ORF type:complete len:285 (-),score=102.96 TRINITY_DN582_c0_g1_i1:41-895(-)